MIDHQSPQQVRLGLRENISQFSLLVLVNAFVGAMVGLERSILPELAQQEFGLAATTGVLSFIVVFGLSKAFTNYLAGRLSEHIGRRLTLILGWLIAVPVPFLLVFASTWSWILFANLLLGISQGLTWSTTVIMKIDLVGPKNRGLAMGLNEFAGYAALAISAGLTGYLASRYGLHPAPFYLGFFYIMAGTCLSFFLVQETVAHAKFEANEFVKPEPLTQKAVFIQTSFKDRNLSSVTQAGLVNNLNDGMAWGLFPILFTVSGLKLDQVGYLAAIYPAVWGVFQIWTGRLSDTYGRKWMIILGMWVQAIGIAITALADAFAGFAIGSVFLGVGTAMVYPTLLAAIGDVAHPSWRASSIGIYRFWRDLGYSVGALVSGVAADLIGVKFAVWIVAGITFMSGCIVATRMSETHKHNR